MCLCKFKQVKLEEPVTVYKVLVKTEEGYVSPFHSFFWEQGVMNTNEDPIEVNETKARGEEVAGGVFHAYKYFEDAVYHLRGFRLGTCLTYEVAKLTIPADAEVYEGVCGFGDKCYASVKMRLDEIVPVSDDDIKSVVHYKVLVNYGDSSWPQTKEEAEVMVNNELDRVKKVATLYDLDKETMVSRLMETVDGYYKLKGWK